MFVRDERAGERVDRLVAVRGQPLAVRALGLARVDRGQRRGDPARLERVRRVRAGSAGLDAELATGLEDRIADLAVLLVGAPQLESGGAGHAVTEGADVLARDRHLAHVEEACTFSSWSAVELLDDLPRVRALDLEAVVLAVHGGAVGARGRAVVVAGRRRCSRRSRRGTAASSHPGRGRRRRSRPRPRGTGCRRR